MQHYVCQPPGAKKRRWVAAGTRQRRGEPGHQAEGALVVGVAGVGGGPPWVIEAVRSDMCGPDSADVHPDLVNVVVLGRSRKSGARVGDVLHGSCSPSARFSLPRPGASDSPASTARGPRIDAPRRPRLL